MRSTLFLSKCVALAAVLAATPLGSAFAEREQVHVEMIETLEAYAVYKMGRYEEAFKAWLALAEKANAQGILNVANMYQAGEGVEKDLSKALYWYRKGAEQGDPHCLLNLAKSYENGLGVEADEEMAQRFFEKAAGAGSAEAQVRTARRLMAGGESDEARMWLERAAAKGDQDALGLMAQLKPSAQIASQPIDPEAKRRVTDLIADMDAAANARDAGWLTQAISSDADIKVRLPGQPEFRTLSRNEYRQLWELTFRRTERYRFSRSTFQLSRDAGGLVLESSIREYLTSNDARTEELRLHETLRLKLDTDNRPVISDVLMRVERPE